MTVIAAYCEPATQTVHMAADSCTQVNGSLVQDAVRKVRRMYLTEGGNDEALIGFAGAGAAARFADDGILPAYDVDPDEWAYRCARAWRDHMLEADLDAESRGESLALLGFDGRLWCLTENMAIPMPAGYGSVGSGGDYATGVLYAAANTGDIPSDLAVFLAAEAACRFDAWCAGPVYVETTSKTI